MVFDDFWYFMCAHFGTVTQCSVDPRCASSAYLKTSRNTLKHLRNFEKLSETLKKSHETSRKWIFFEFRPLLSAMEQPRPGGTTFVIVVKTSRPGKYLTRPNLT